MSKAIELIIKEREHQIFQEGYDADHDALHENGEIALAAACYAAHPCDLYTKEELHNSVEFRKLRPFDEYDIDDKKSEIRKLVIAGALIVAEIERLQSINPTIDE